ncbi:MAG: tripartite tricarboxylate transporter TctB family protein [Roseburia sp.]
MKEKTSLMDRIDAKRDAISEKLAAKEVEFPVELAAGMLFLLVGAAVLLGMPSQVMVSETDVVNGRAFPTLLMAVMMVFCAVLIIKELYGVLVQKKPLTKKKMNLLVEVKALEIFAILLLTFFLCKALNLFVVGACVCGLCFLFYFRCRKGSYYVITLTAAVLIWGIFRFGLGVNF